MVIFLASQGRAHAIDYRERAPGGAHAHLYDGSPRASRDGPLAVAVPGEAAGLQLALQNFGTKSMAEAAAPAIGLAQEGFRVEAHLARALSAQRGRLAADGELASVFLHDDLSPYREGETLRRRHLAQTLQLLAHRGAGAFYHGAVAADITAALSKADGAVLTAEDLAAYRALERAPLITGYRGLDVVSMPPPSSGGATMAEALAVLEAYPLGDLGHGSATYLHLLAETFKAVFADRARFYGDPDFIDLPLARLLSPAHAAGLRRGMSSVLPTPASAYGRAIPAEDGGTSHISVIDAAGNAVACTSSVNTSFGAAVGVPGRGIVLNNTMDDFARAPGVANVYGLVGGRANAIEGGKRPLSSMSPTIVIDRGRVRLVAGASGGPLIISSTLQTLLGIIDFDLELAHAVAAARIHHQWMPDKLGLETGIADATVANLRRLGHPIVKLERAGAVAAVESVADAGSTLLHAVADPRKGGRPAAY